VTLHRPAHLTPSRARLLFLPILVALGAGGASAQLLDRRAYEVQSWGTAQDLPNGVVTSLTLDRRGFLYVGTMGGLARFDGQSFAAMSVSDLPLLRSNQVSSLAIASRDGLWIGTPEGLLLRLERGTLADSLAPFVDDQEAVQRILPSSAGDLWALSNHRVRRFRDGSWRDVPHAPLVGVVTDLLEDGAGGIWLSDGDGLQRLSAGSFVRQPLPRSLGRAVFDLALDPAGRLWLAAGGGLGVRELDGTIRPVRVALPEGSVVTALAAGPDSTLWLGGSWGVAVVRPGGARGAAPLAPIYRHAGDWANATIRSLVVDTRGVAVVGTGGSGLRIFSPRLFSRITMADGLPGLAVHHLLGDGDSAVLVGVGCGSVSRLTARGVRRLPDRDFGIVDPCLRSLHRDPLGALWLGQYGRVSVRRPDGRVVSTSLDGVALPRAAGPILPDGAGGAFVGTLRGGLVRIDSSGRGARVPEVPREGVYALTRDSTGAVWVGLSGKLMRLGGEAPLLLTAADGVPPGPIRVLRAEPDGTIWLGSYGGGIGRLRDGHIARLTTDGGLFDDAISALLPDGQGRYWLMGNLGLLAVRRGRLDSVLSGYVGTLDGVRMGPDDGIPEGNGGHPAAWRTPDGHLLFASVDGITVVHEEQLARVHVPPGPVLVSVGADSLGLTTADSAVLPARATATTLHLSAPLLGGAEQLQFRYRFRGRGEAWTDLGSRHDLVLPALGSGRHELEIGVRSLDGTWSEQPTLFALLVPQVWWKSWWLRALLGAGIVAGIVQLLRLRYQAVERRNQELRHEIAQREQAELRAQQHLHDLAHVSRVATAGELATSLAHELNQPLAAIVGNADAGRRMLQRDGMTTAQVDEILDEIAREGRRASDIIRSLRQFLRRESGDRRLVDLREVVVEVLPILRNQLEEASTEVELELPDDLPPVRGDRTALQQVVVNLVVNAADAMRELPVGQRRVKIAAERYGDGVRLAVRDSGPGVPAALQSEIFEPFTTSKPGGMGMGLAICRSIVESHDGSIEVGSATGGGAVFLVTLPGGDET
jgi:signal transduction histidine kinase/ligand-binding sensor domain-containing protein